MNVYKLWGFICRRHNRKKHNSTQKYNMHFKVIFLILSFLPSIVLSHPVFNFTKVDLPSTSVGPESITFDTKYGEEPYYTGISDGRILKYDGANGFMDYAFTVPNR